jgi:hypothetical protein
MASRGHPVLLVQRLHTLLGHLTLRLQMLMRPPLPDLGMRRVDRVLGRDKQLAL